jgi:hypothetical protein
MHDYDETLTLLREIASERPDYVYRGWKSVWSDDFGDFVYERGDAPGTGIDSEQSCRYRDPHTGEPDCIVGTLLARLGYELTDDDEGSSAFGLDSVKSNFTLTAQNLLAFTQNLQDNGMPWGKAVEEGHEKAQVAVPA